VLRRNLIVVLYTFYLDRGGQISMPPAIVNCKDSKILLCFLIIHFIVSLTPLTGYVNDRRTILGLYGVFALL
jgi:hypothetical protein